MVIFEILRIVIVIAGLYMIFGRKNDGKSFKSAMNIYLGSFGLLFVMLMVLIAKMVFGQ